MPGKFGLKRWFGVFAISAFFSVPAMACQTPPVIWVDTDISGGTHILTLKGRSEGTCRGRYEFSVTRSGSVGRSASRQAGNFSTGSDAETVISRIAINIDLNDTWSAEAAVFLDGGQYVNYSVGRNGP